MEVGEGNKTHILRSKYQQTTVLGPNPAHHLLLKIKFYCIFTYVMSMVVFML